MRINNGAQKRKSDDFLVLWKIGQNHISDFIETLSRPDKRKYSKEGNVFVKGAKICENHYQKAQFIEYLIRNVVGLDMSPGYFSSFEEILLCEYPSDYKILSIIYLFSKDSDARSQYENDKRFVDLREEYHIDDEEESESSEDEDEDEYFVEEEMVMSSLSSTNPEKTYIGKIENVNDHFYNFVPEYHFVDNKISKIHDIYELFPNDGRIKLYEFQTTFLAKYCEDNIINNYIIFSFSMKSLEDNDNVKVTQKINVERTDIKQLSENKIFRIAQIDTDAQSEDDKIILKNCNYIKDEKVIVKYFDGEVVLYLKPKPVFYRQIDGVYYISTDIKVTKLIQGYTHESIERAKVFNTQTIEEYYVDANKLSGKDLETVDIMTESEILMFFANEMNSNYTKDGVLLSSKLVSVLDLLKKGHLFTSEIANPKIITKRKETLIDYLNQIQSKSDLFDEAIDFICKLLLTTEVGEYENENINKVVSQITQNPEILLSMESYNIYSEQIKNLKAQKQELESTNNNIQYQINTSGYDEFVDRNSYKYEDLSHEITVLESKINTLKSEKEEVEGQVNWFKSEYNTYNSMYEIEQAIGIAKTEYEFYVKHNKNLEDDFNNIIKQKFIENKTQSLINSQLTSNLDNEYQQCYDAVSNKKTIKVTGDLGSHLICEVQKVRGYSGNDIINIFASIYTGFMTIFSGRPGTGKTSICNIISKVLGMDKFGTLNNVNLNRFVPISVERGWTSKKDLLGYYNPLTKVFDKSNKHLFDALSIQHKEVQRKDCKYPLFVLLDEANLSPIEYYWGDFMKISDFDNIVSADLNLGNDVVLEVSKNLRFLATINNDHTTEDISPRLIDRSWIIELPDSDDDKTGHTDYDRIQTSIISWEEIEEYFESYRANKINIQIESLLEQIYLMLDENDTPINRRSQNMILEYIKTTQNIYSNYGFTALDFAVLQKIIPTIAGSGENYCAFLEKLNELCRNNNLIKSANMLDLIIKNGKDNMYYFNYFR